MVLERIVPMSAAKIGVVVYAGLGLIFGLILSVVSLIGLPFAASGGGESSGLGPIGGLIFGLGGIVILPIFYGIIGFLSGLISAALYNLGARFAGGLELHFRER